MPKIKYQSINLRGNSLALVETCNGIIEEYQSDGLQLTLRQLYYQLVSRDVIRNKVTEYKRLGCIVNDARLAGLIDWDSIEDRTRNLESVAHWSSPDEIIGTCANQYRIDKWATQAIRPEVWIEKEALAGVFDRICTELDVPYFACRGYTSQSEMWGAAMRFVKYIVAGQKVHVFHFGDHDPSGIDMTRDIQDRIRMFISKHADASHFSLTRVALNMDQVRKYHPPENPAKATDARFQGYADKFGESSWELDALNPRTLAALVRSNIKGIRQETKWNVAIKSEVHQRAILETISDEWDGIQSRVENEFDDMIRSKESEELEGLE